MLRIRLRRVGKKKQPAYRLVVADSRAPRDGAFVEIIGHYNPRTDPAIVEIDDDKARGWLSRGAQPSETVARLLAGRGILEKTEKVGRAGKTERPKKAEMTEETEKAEEAEKSEDTEKTEKGAS